MGNILSFVVFFFATQTVSASELTLVVEDIYGWSRSKEVHRAVFDVSGSSCFDVTIHSWWEGKSNPAFIIRIFGEMTPVNKNQDLVVSYMKQIQSGENVLAVISQRTIVVEANQHAARIEDIYHHENELALWQRNNFSYKAPPPPPAPGP